jgi:transmembrane sensor
MMTRSTTTAPASDATTEEAIAWFVRTHSDQRTLADEDRFAQWLKQDPRHAQAYARIEKVWRTAGPEITPRALPGEYDAQPDGTKPWRARRWAITGLAAALAAMAVGTGYLLNERDRISAGTFATEAGTQRELRLADGSRITLNTRSEVSVDLGEHLRAIRLTRGEARFQVAKDASRPFVVDAGAARVRAVGTQFDVRRSDARVAVTLIEGRVEVTPTLESIKIPEPALLTAGQQLSLEIDSGQRRVETVNLVRANAWIHQQLIFDSVPLPAAVEEANRYLQTPIAIDDPTLADIRVSGVVRAGNVESFVGTLEASFPVEAVERPDGQVGLMRRSNVQTP